ncbi:hypothetical protein KVR01_007768 [Diaporthe batatas]|uniref:uncharacterized protein n=1 Tax=Diaporthe batatas TaxID=748121 RepID=UPI001D0414AD|nr:uncharacterized protein KVR01_007768 [Diaporthe batatas]KAG8162003.1 hypothetical protein KVR01_007768 [Diaporthe batatas]
MAPDISVRKTDELSKSGEIDLSALEKSTSNSFGTVENSTAPARDLGLLAIIAIGWNICNSWAAIAATLAISVASGGPVTLIYGIIIIFIFGAAFFMSLVAFIVITITCLAESNPKQSSDFVWREFVNTSGWSSDGVVFLTGLVNPNFIFSGLDGAIHLAEECTNAAVAVPRALVSTVVIGFVTALVFAIGMCYSYHDFDAVLASPSV